jgi:hypothetical protein
MDAKKRWTLSAVIILSQAWLLWSPPGQEYLGSLAYVLPVVFCAATAVPHAIVFIASRLGRSDVGRGERWARRLFFEPARPRSI